MTYAGPLGSSWNNQCVERSWGHNFVFFLFLLLSHPILWLSVYNERLNSMYVLHMANYVLNCLSFLKKVFNSFSIQKILQFHCEVIFSGPLGSWNECCLYLEIRVPLMRLGAWHLCYRQGITLINRGCYFPHAGYAFLGIPFSQIIWL